MSSSSSSAPSLTLTYLDIPARAFPIRFALRCGGVDFLDERLSRAELASRRGAGGRSAAVPLGQLPTLTLDGEVFTQSVALARWAAAQGSAPLAPPSVADALRVDEVVAIVDELWVKLPRNIEPPEALRQARAGWAAETARRFLDVLAARAEARGGPLFLGAQPTLADAFFVALAEQFTRGAYDGVPRDLLRDWPQLMRLVAAFKAHALFHKYGEPM